MPRARGALAAARLTRAATARRDRIL